MQPICTYELRFVRERSLVSCLVMAPIVTRPRASRRLSGAGLGIDTESEIRVYDILDADADSNGPGSTWGRTHGSSGVHNISDNANPLPTPPSRKSAQQHAARSTGHAQQPHDAADTPPPDSPASVIVAHTATPAAPDAKPRQEQMTRQSSTSQHDGALASAGAQQTEQKQKQTRTTRDVDAPQQAAQPGAAAAKSANTTAIVSIVELALSTGVPLTLSWAGPGTACVIELGVTQPVAADCGDADAGDDASPCAEEPTWLKQAWAKLHDKDLVDADAFAPGTGLAGHFDEESAAGSLGSAPAEAVASPDIPLVHEPAPALSQVLATGGLVDMLTTLGRPAVQPTVPLVAEQTSAEEASAAEQQQQLRVATDAACAIAAIARARTSDLKRHQC